MKFSWLGLKIIFSLVTMVIALGVFSNSVAMSVPLTSANKIDGIAQLKNDSRIKNEIFHRVIVSPLLHVNLHHSLSVQRQTDITGAIDFHVHSAPDITPRSVDDFQLAKMAADAGMKAVVLKNHVTPTSDRALLANKIVPDIELFGGVVLNYPVGGLNPRAVETMYRLGKGKGKVVWFPTIDADYHRQVFHLPEKGIRVAREGNLLPEVAEILQLIAQYDLVLGTGHLSPEEIELLVNKATTLGIDKILITHAMADVPGLSLAQMEKLASCGAFLELTYVNELMGSGSAIKAHQHWHRVSLQQMAEAIKYIGAQHFVLSTDLGRSLDPLPVDGYQKFVQGLIDEGISQTEIDSMSKDNPTLLLSEKKSGK